MNRRCVHRSLEETKRLILHAAAQLFLQQGYTATSLREIAATAGVNIGSLTHAYENKESILADLVEYVLQGQFSAAAEILQGVTEDKVLFWAFETTLQLYLAESQESIRELYLTAYSHPKSMNVIYQHIAPKLQESFQCYRPQYEAKEFYELEIATGGVMHSFMAVPCDIYFTMNRKVRRYLESTFLLYGIPSEKTAEAIAFVSGFDFPALAGRVVEGLIARLDGESA